MIKPFRSEYAKGVIRDIIGKSSWTFHYYTFDWGCLCLTDVTPSGKKGALYLPFTIENIPIVLVQTDGKFN